MLLTTMSRFWGVFGDPRVLTWLVVLVCARYAYGVLGNSLLLWQRRCGRFQKPHAVLDDAGFSLLPRLYPERLSLLFRIVDDAPTVAALSWFFLAAAGFITTEDGITCVCDWILIFCTGLILKGISQSLTILPDSSGQGWAGAVRLRGKRVASVRDVLLDANDKFYCDMMPSGHTFMVSNCAWHYCRLYGAGLATQMVVAAFVVVYGVLLVGFREHYSVDVWLAIVLAVALCSHPGFNAAAFCLY